MSHLLTIAEDLLLLVAEAAVGGATTEGGVATGTSSIVPAADPACVLGTGEAAVARGNSCRGDEQNHK